MILLAVLLDALLLTQISPTAVPGALTSLHATGHAARTRLITSEFILAMTLITRAQTQLFVEWAAV